MRIVLLGMPAAGKGTQAALLSAKIGIPHISTGSMFRQAIRGGGWLGRLVAEHIGKGQLVPDEVTIQVVEQRLSEPDCRGGFVLDGFPRTIAQAYALSEIASQLGPGLDSVVNIIISRAEAIRRVLNRRVCSVCGATYTSVDLPTVRCRKCGGTLKRRTDDTKETAKKRLQVYAQQTEPVCGYYEELGLLRTVDGEGSIESVHARIMQVVSARKRDIGEAVN